MTRAPSKPLEPGPHGRPKTHVCAICRRQRTGYPGIPPEGWLGEDEQWFCKQCVREHRITAAVIVPPPMLQCCACGVTRPAPQDAWVFYQDLWYCDSCAEKPARRR